MLYSHWPYSSRPISNRLVVVKNMVEPYVIQQDTRVRDHFREIATS